MCEPCHSLIQIPADSFLLNNLNNANIHFGRQVGAFYHFSALGNGHSETAALCGISPLMTDRSTTSYEADWWNRQFRFDFNYINIAKNLNCEEFTAAEEYANKVSIGSLSIFRNFFEKTLAKTARPNAYFSRMDMMLNNKGQEQYHMQMKRAGIKIETGIYSAILGATKQLSRKKIESGVKICLGFTRKRNLLTGEWADNNDLWDKKGKEVSIFNQN